MAVIGLPCSLAQIYVVIAISQMSNSLPRTMRRNAAISGSTSSKSNSKVFGFTVPSFSDLLLPCVRVTAFSFGPVMDWLQMTDDGGQRKTTISEGIQAVRHPSSAIRRL